MAIRRPVPVLRRQAVVRIPGSGKTAIIRKAFLARLLAKASRDAAF
ncbi:hypothetical protein RAA17_01255 [Komagataeibacter rhaeticus]|nr:hypothetical protein [Komagataeibacter rhaeticus]